MVAEIQLGCGYITLVDDADFDCLAHYHWRAQRSKCILYAVAQMNGHIIRLHRFLLNAPSHMQVDHRNGNALDNRRENIRLCTQTQNNANRHLTRGQSHYKGVTWEKRQGYWLAKIKCRGKLIRLGSFLDEDQAALAYNLAATQLFGDFAYCNQVPHSDVFSMPQGRLLPRLARSAHCRRIWSMRLRERRQFLNLRLADLARQTGISRKSLGEYERVGRIPLLEKRTTIACALDVTVAYLLGETDAADLLNVPSGEPGSTDGPFGVPR